MAMICSLATSRQSSRVIAAKSNRRLTLAIWLGRPRRPARLSSRELLGAQGDLVVAVADARGGAGHDGRVEAVQHLADPLGVGAEHGHELGGGHLLPLA